MSFWKNPRYSAFERQTSGDPIRGLGRQDFPWRLISVTREDPAGDPWELVIQAASIGEQDPSGKVLVSLEARATCRPGADRLQRLGYHPDRLRWMGLDGENLIRETLEVQVRIPLEQLGTLAKTSVERLRRYVFELYDDTRKSNAIRNRLEAFRISGFAADTHLDEVAR